ncbi:hypothetical protein [Burkholderia glumae]|uniref:hypothetical protein n=1 Tax=Burkholderia glumae TaxID=337 RepID=UPI002151003B|nr:hypothetical protein [Burkholderia glumae]
MLEKTVEAYLVERVRALGGEPYKFTSPARASVPDRIVVLPPGRVYFIEVKRPGGKLTRGQEREHEHLRRLGADVRVLDSIGAINAFVNEVQAVAAPVAPAAPVAEYDGNHVQNHCTECNEHEAECSCAQAVAADGASTDDLLQLDVLLAAFREAVWEAGSNAWPAYGIAGKDEAKAIQRHVRAMLSRERAAVSPATSESKCTRCGSSTAQACNERGCFYLESGEGEPATADERHEDGLLTTEALISIIERHFDHDHPDGQRLVEMAQDVAASQHKQGEPATADERAAFEKVFPVPPGLQFAGGAYSSVVLHHDEDEYRKHDRIFVQYNGAWLGWKACASQAAAPADMRASQVKFSQFLTDVITAAGLLQHGRTDKKLAARIGEMAFSMLGSSPSQAAAPASPACRACDAGVCSAHGPEQSMAGKRVAAAPADAREPQWSRDIIADLQGLFDTDGITENDSGDALIRLSDAIAAVENARPVAPADAGEAVGVADSMPGTSGFTMACFEAAKVPIGTKLYAAAQGGKGGEA